MDILKVAILEMSRIRADKSFCPSEVVRAMYPESWRHFLTDVREKAWEMYLEGEINLSQKGKSLDKHQKPRGPLRISKPISEGGC
ncbi:MAG TPA: DUF3253 domain-containing protein [Algoriphagus sp.]|jgi:hypothetical protein|uniref:DUF3253 domain-containing protein n=1 Tax=Algoriphagus ornithinivorans TaxID=226506 RepID=A0A1I5GRN5_9BACT|nr:MULTISPECIES: DUF3253 domain-containing protein [Algoriphagus]MAL12719.1 DUF3253 domain-containing protein [Algoriphagus sp.]MAN85343.1 DUF3253 domain-containing protein [Algoriphagus sp.]QYH38496.1 DUF3253 domain-containing protein [Algoriphagus sp. NBT04N3]SFO38675.1 Protein of unknown function [Algoriphagus ornithinivorans]HAD49980.1 DUF3253 domain-containing protein [Algoriphagus sp.]|tara:strand:+ start:13614 stop:13868 length:255 start_codon:yes stop_codon:yes gene_type:complete